ncbi:MAG: CHRD domain-containing protein [Caldilineaceae bacterium]
MPQTHVGLSYRVLCQWWVVVAAVVGAALFTGLLLTGMAVATADHPMTAFPNATAIQTADIHLFEANLSPANEVPAVDSAAAGRAVLALITDTLYYRVLVADIDKVTAAHIHEAAPGVNGPVIFPLFTGSGVFDPANPISGTVTLTPTQVAKLMAGDYYINVHTSDAPSGEIRGQVRAYTPGASYNALLLGRNEATPVTTNAKGVAQFTLANTNTLQYQLAVSDIISITASHIHFGPTGKNGPVVHGLYNGSGAFDPANPISGVITLTAKHMVDLLTGYYYVNVHTSANPGGEIRGQIGGVRLFQANLTGAAEVPARSTSASGRAVLALSADATKLSYRVMVNDIEDITASHIHTAPTGVNGGIIFPLFSNASGAFDPANPISGTLDLTLDQVMALIVDQYYINVHTSTAPAGAIRGQVVAYQPPAHMMAPLSGADEVPAVTTDAVGIARLLLNPSLDTLHYSVWVTDIVDITASHIHFAPTGKNGPVVFPLYMGSGAFDPAHPVGGAVALSAKNWVDLLTGYYYVNVHTSANPSGAIRGQVGGARLFIAELTGANEVPTVTTSATGKGIMALNANATAADFRVMVQEIDNITMAHIHQAPVGVNGPIIAPLFLGVGLFAPANPISGTAPVNTPQVLHLLAGDYYVNVHTTDHPAGEIRGQIEPYTPEATWVATLTGAQETPPVTTTASGEASFALAADLNILHYTVNVTDIVSVTASHIHVASAGKSGPVVFPLFSSSQGVFDADHPVGGCLQLTSKNLVDLVTGYYYVNVHTSAHPGGEIRGQMTAAGSAQSILFLPVIAHNE